ncbi:MULTISPECIES: ArsR/SmtB family transcription factor [Nocardiopsis]|uniref:DNA-binding transcriptional ArsR family regulator n=1 Tax=Nocardiopsis sinuspersici TaxID=501010 RepID=A0A1V3BYX6_9ACTN|nr:MULTISPECIES: winged helix-turn-helix domain-containing protein [Nocardiopsis]NYH55026.1 DNA-binding transcriptional ArsR family regulator [Nocardiopsis sinuspersici]OOC53747.1 transcriptional regulator [Nocardiopsis sinuspersici]
MGEPKQSGAAPRARTRRPATVREAKALAHPARVRILRLCLSRELTNKELADRLDTTPGTVLYHVRQLVDAGLLAPAPVRTGASGALEKPYRSTGETWWLDGPLADTDTGSAAPVEAFQQELSEAGPESVRTFARFVLHLSDEDVQELYRRVLAVLDEYVATDDQRSDQPRYAGMFLLHRPAD